jgi:hypothetical protein
VSKKTRPWKGSGRKRRLKRIYRRQLIGETRAYNARVADEEYWKMRDEIEASRL